MRFRTASQFEDGLPTLLSERIALYGARHQCMAITTGNGCPDGIHDDVQGHLWAAMARLGGSLQIDPRGIMLGCVPVPNGDLLRTPCAFGGLDSHDIDLTRRKDRAMPDRIPVKIRPLSGEAFRPYGQVLERGGLVYPDTDDGRVVMELLQVRRRPDAHQIPQLAIHFSYNQTGLDHGVGHFRPLSLTRQRACWHIMALQ
jgi:hypothetical protein